MSTEGMRWEYKLIDSEAVRKSGGVFKAKSTQDIEAYLNRLGRSGWEIVSMDFSDVKSVFFGLAKRPLSTPWEPLAKVQAEAKASDAEVEGPTVAAASNRGEELFSDADDDAEAIIHRASGSQDNS